jgi:hypothetical protein
MPKLLLPLCPNLKIRAGGYHHGSQHIYKKDSKSPLFLLQLLELNKNSGSRCFFFQ